MANSSHVDAVTALDELFGAIDKYRTSEGFQELLAFLQKLPTVGEQPKSANAAIRAAHVNRNAGLEAWAAMKERGEIVETDGAWALNEKQKNGDDRGM